MRVWMYSALLVPFACAKADEAPETKAQAASSEVKPARDEVAPTLPPAEGDGGGESKSETERMPVPASPKKGTRGNRMGGPLAPNDQPTPQGAMTLPNVKDCFRACVDRNQVRSVSPQQIDEDCKGECKEACLGHCDSGSLSERSACKSSCERQTLRVR